MNDVVKSFDIETKEPDTSGDVRFEGWLARYDNRDSDGDIIKQGAFRESVASLGAMRRKFPVLFMHDMREHIGVFDNVEERSEGVYVNGVIAGDIPRARDQVIPMMRRGWLNSLSVGFTVDKQRWEEETRIIEKGRLWEGSIVTIPANEDAAIISVKAFKGALAGEKVEKFTYDDVQDMSLAEVEARLAQHNISRHLSKMLTSGLSRLRDEDRESAKRRDGVNLEDELKQIGALAAQLATSARG